MYQVGKVFILTLIVFLISAKLPKKALEMSCRVFLYNKEVEKIAKSLLIHN